MDRVGGAGLDVGDEIVGDVVGDAVRPEVPVELVLGFEPRESPQRGQHLAGGALGRTVVHDGDGGVERGEQAGMIAHIEAVMGDLVEIHLGDPDLGPDQLRFSVPSQVAAVEETEVPEAQDPGGAVGVVGGVGGLEGGGEFRQSVPGSLRTRACVPDRRILPMGNCDSPTSGPVGEEEGFPHGIGVRPKPK